MKNPRPTVRRFLAPALALAVALSLTGCVGFWGQRYQHHEATSVVQFLYPDKDLPFVQPEIPTLHLPLRAGVAFIPSAHQDTNFTEQQKIELLRKVAAQFKAQPFVQSIEVIPSTYLRPGGSFENLDQLRGMLGIDVVVLISYDQAQNSRDTEWSIAYWTIFGAYTVEAQRNSTNTLVEAVVYDIPSRSLLFRAPGTSAMINNATLFRTEHELRKDAAQGITQAADQMTLNLAQELELFKIRMREEPQTVRVVHKPGYSGGGSIEWFSALALLGLLAAAALAGRRNVARHAPEAAR